jgi:sulfide:quinone oxidoreductase
MLGPHWRQSVFEFYTLAGSIALGEKLRGWTGGRLVVHIVDMPIKCPVAPLEFCFLADWYLRRRGVRDAVELTYVTSLDAAFTKPVAAEHLAGLLDAKGSRLETEFATGRIDGGTRRLVSWDEREVPFDLLVSVPLHGGAEFVERSPGLGDELGFVRVDPHTLQSTAAPNVFALGDATNVPISKAGSVTHFEGNTLPAHPDAAGRPAGHVGARDAHAAAPDGEAGHPADPRVRGARVGLGRRPLRLQGECRHVQALRRRLRRARRRRDHGR